GEVVPEPRRTGRCERARGRREPWRPRVLAVLLALEEAEELDVRGDGPRLRAGEGTRVVEVGDQARHVGKGGVRRLCVLELAGGRREAESRSTPRVAEGLTLPDVELPGVGDGGGGDDGAGRAGVHADLARIRALD